MTLSKEVLDLFRTMITDPEKKGIDIKPLKEVFVKSDTITPCSELYKQYLEYIDGRPLPKMIFYIIMREVYGNITTSYLDASGTVKHCDGGYYLRMNPIILRDLGYYRN